jgi:hypothetical protein
LVVAPGPARGIAIRTVRKEIHAASRGHVSREQVDALVASAGTTIALPDAAAERRVEIQNLLSRLALVRKQLGTLSQTVPVVILSGPRVNAHSHADNPLSISRCCIRVQVSAIPA